MLEPTSSQQNLGPHAENYSLSREATYNFSPCCIAWGLSDFILLYAAIYNFWQHDMMEPTIFSSPELKAQTIF